MPLSGSIDTGQSSNVGPYTFFLLALDGNHYIIASNVNNVTPVNCDALSIPNPISAAQWATDLAGAGLSGYNGALTYGMTEGVLPVSGTSMFYVTGTDTNETQEVFLRYKINADSSQTVDGGVILSGNLGSGNGPNRPYGYNTIGSYSYAVYWSNKGLFDDGDYYLCRIPTSGTFSGTFASVMTQFQTATGLYFSAGTGAAIVADPRGIKILSYLTHYRMTHSPPAGTTLSSSGCEYWIVDPATQTVVQPLTNAQAAFGQPWPDSGTLYSGAASTSQFDDYVAPIVNTVSGGYEVIFIRRFSDNPTVFRCRRYFVNGTTGAITYVDTFEQTITGASSVTAAYVPRDGGNLLFGGVSSNGETWYFGQFAEAAPSLPVTTAPPPTPIVSLNRAWTYNMDGHHFYVLDLGAEGTFVYDPSTEMWSEFETNGSNWSMVAGCMYGDRVVAGDLATTDVWELVPSAVKDSGSNAYEIDHTATGGLMLRSRVYRSCAALRLALSWGEYQDTSTATISLSYSDDWGETYSTPITISLTESDFKNEVVWNSIGSFAAPGRIFKITDVGGPLRIDGADAMLDDFDDNTSQ